MYVVVVLFDSAVRRCGGRRACIGCILATHSRHASSTTPP